MVRAEPRLGGVVVEARPVAGQRERKLRLPIACAIDATASHFSLTIRPEYDGRKASVRLEEEQCHSVVGNVKVLLVVTAPSGNERFVELPRAADGKQPMQVLFARADSPSSLAPPRNSRIRRRRHRTLRADPCHALQPQKEIPRPTPVPLESFSRTPALS